MLKGRRNALVFVLLSFFWLDVGSAIKQIESVRLWHSPNKTRVVFDVSGDVKYKFFDLKNPDRLVIDIDDGGLKTVLPLLEDNEHVKGMRAGAPKKGVFRVVFDLKQALRANAFVLPPNELYGHRLVVDMLEMGASVTDDPTIGLEPKVEVKVDSNDNSSPLSVSQSDRAREDRKLKIAIDAGHGGEDPGAIGHKGSREKRITLSIAKRLKSVIDRDPKMSAFLVRTGDYYIKLHERRQIARSRGADLFISLHADAFNRRSANGLSVFALSQRGATSAMASAIAEKQNASDLIGGVSLADKDEVLAKVLVDLSMTATISDSVNLGGRVLKELSGVGRLHSKRVEQAGFAVLKSPDMPSILVETGFITNPEEERKLGTSSYQTKLAQAIYSAIAKFFAQTPYLNNGNYSAPKLNANTRSNSSTTIKHKVRRGDNLSELAQRYGTTIKAIKRENNLKRTTLWLGETLKITSSKSVRSASSNSNTGKSSARSNIHTVRRGESLSIISARYNVAIAHLKRLNNLKSNTVFIGQKLKISSNKTAARATKSQVHIVKRGDTLSEIALKYKSSVRAIMQHNKLRSKTVYLGQRLNIPG